MINNVKEVLERFFEEKELNFEAWEIEHNGNTHFIDNDFIIDVILNSTGKKEQNQIMEKIVWIDFKNGNVNHFLKFLADAYVKVNY